MSLHAVCLFWGDPTKTRRCICRVAMLGNLQTSLKGTLKNDDHMNPHEPLGEATQLGKLARGSHGSSYRATFSYTEEGLNHKISEHMWPWVKIQIVPPVNIPILPILTKIGSKMVGEFTYQPKWDPKTVLTTTAMFLWELMIKAAQLAGTETYGHRYPPIRRSVDAPGQPFLEVRKKTSGKVK